MHGPRTEAAEQIQAEKHRLEGETFEDAARRRAKAMADSPEHEAQLLDILLNERFAEGGRVQSSMGSPKMVTAFNCFVMPEFYDSFVAGDNSIMKVAGKAAETMRMGGGVGYNYGTLRPNGALIKKLQSQSSGPVGFMGINDVICRLTSSAGNRRGAQMAVMPIWHPDIMEFIAAKQPGPDIQPLWDMVEAMEDGDEKWELKQALQHTLNLKGFNISVGVTDEFMESKAAGKGFDLRFGGKVYQTVDPNEIWDRVMRSTRKWAEPGVLFLDTINRMNNLWYCETITATNPCAEQPLPPNGACLLGSLNLTKYLVRDWTVGWKFDWDQFIADIPVVQRALDNVIDRTIYPLEEQEREAKNKRRMGIGIMGLANAAEALGLPYGTKMFLDFEADILTTMNVHLYKSSCLLAKEKGAFPMLDKIRYLEAPFIKNLDKSMNGQLSELIRKYGIRNSHLSSIAPTGTISLAADNVSSGIEPVFSYQAKRKIKRPGGEEEVMVDDYGVGFLDTKGRRSSDIGTQEHIDVLLTAARHVDSAVSKTLNVDPGTSDEDFHGIYDKVWEGGGKGCTTFDPSGGLIGVMESADEPAGPTCEIINGVRSCE